MPLDHKERGSVSELDEDDDNASDSLVLFCLKAFNSSRNVGE